MFPTRITIHDFEYTLDGGTTILRATDETQRSHEIILVQHMFPQPDPLLEHIPGRLYLDGSLIPMRSRLEGDLLNLLKTANVSHCKTNSVQGQKSHLSPNALIVGDDIRQVLTSGPEENIRNLVAEVIRFVESEACIRFSVTVEQAADPTRYALWPAWDSASRNQVAVRLGRVLGIGIQPARELLERGTPLAESVSALQVSELAEKYAADGLAIRVEPPFPWPLE